ncbi:MFS transporter [Hypericibacter sp.]|uniref:MFS transporter n=1 Tax=Hypericibacter sp. TaxID=2705401 RepID=UPI003D6C8F5D
MSELKRIGPATGLEPSASSVDQGVAVKPASEALAPFHHAPLYWLALGTFAVGTEGFMIAAILPGIATDLSVSVQAAGQLMGVFALTYALSSPILTALTGAVNRRKLLILSMSAFAAANVVAALAPHYGSLLGARILLALSAGLYVPNANALAGALVPPERRGRALAIVGGGISLAVALGVPLGAFIGAHFGWRMTFVGVAVLASLALLGLLFGMPRGIGDGLAVASLRERITIVRQPAALLALGTTAIWAMGGYTVYTYVAPFLTATTGLAGSSIGYALFLWGAAAFSGLLLGGHANDRFGGRLVISVTLPLMGLALISFSVIAHSLTVTAALAPLLVAIVVWGITGWGFFPAQQARLIGITGVKGASIILSLNASFMYLGFSLGAALGSFVLTQASLADLGWVGGLCVLASFLLYLATHDQASRTS